jgi:hypothetical protein
MPALQAEREDTISGEKTLYIVPRQAEKERSPEGRGEARPDKDPTKKEQEPARMPALKGGEGHDISCPYKATVAK